MSVPNLRIRVLDHPGAVGEFWDWLTQPGRRMVSADTETTGLDWWSPTFQIRLIQFGDVEGGWAIPFQEWKGLVKGALDWCSKARIPLVWHNVAYDSQALRAEGIELDWSIVQDTFAWQVVSGHADENRQLKVLATRAFGGWASAGERVLKEGMKAQGWDWATVPLDWKPYPLYGVVDTCITAALWELWADRRKAWAADHALEIAAIRITGEMAWRGVPTDGAYLWEQITEHEEREAEILARLKHIGITNPAQNGQLELVLKSDGYPLAEKTVSGKAKLDKDVLEHIDHPAARDVLAYRWNHRVLGTYLKPIFEGSGGVLERGFLHPGIKSMEARTSRMSVENPPLQQLPAGDPVVRRAIIPRADDEVIVSSDYGQIELRLWAAINKDQPMLTELKDVDASGGDFFVNLGRTVYGEPDFQKSDKRRTLLKSTVYAKLFGGGIETAAGQAGVNVYSLVPTWKALEATYPSLKTLGSQLIQTRQTPEGTEHVATSPWGREFKVRDQQERRKLGNYVTQGSAAIALKKALVGLDAAGFGPHMLLPVHDEVLFSLPKDNVEDAMTEIAEVMDSVIDPDLWGIAVRAEPGAGASWAEAK